MIINSQRITESDDNVIVEALIEYSNKKEKLWFSLPKDYKQYITQPNLDGFLVGLLPLAMKLGEDIEVKGAISKKLYFNLTNYLMVITQVVLPYLKKVNITVEYLNENKISEDTKGVVAGFSAGIDSFSTLSDYYLNNKIDGYKITHLIFNNVGSNGEWESIQSRKLFNSRYESIKDLPMHYKIPFLKVDSNLSDLLKMEFLHTSLINNASVILLLQKLFSKYYISSGHHYKDTSCKPVYDIAIAESMIVHLLSTETTECICAGCQYTRVEKTKKLLDIPEATHFLNVCIAPKIDAKNCSQCEKCCRTLLALEVLGIIDSFRDVFDLDLWKRHSKKRYLIKTLESNNLYMNEIRAYAKSIGYHFKLSDIVLSKSYNYSSIFARILHLNRNRLFSKLVRRFGLI